MKYAVYVLAVLLLVLAGSGWFLYTSKIEPMISDYERMKAALPEWDRAAGEMRKLKERDRWIGPAVEALRAGLDDEIKAGLAEIAATPNGAVVVNLSEKALYTPGAVTFGQNSLPTLQKLASLLKTLKDLAGKDFLIINSAATVPSTGTGRKKKPGIDGRELAARRSLALVKYLTDKEGLPPESLIAAAGPEKMPDRGFAIKEQRTMIVISLPQTPVPQAQPQQPAPPRQAPIPITPATPPAPQ